MRRTYKFRMRPTRGQHLRLNDMLGDHCRLYNAALEERRGLWKWGKVATNYGQQSAQLSSIRSDVPNQARWSFSSQQATIRRLNLAFDAFYRRCKKGDTPGFPRYRSFDRFDSVVWPTDGDGCRWKPEAGRVYLQGIGHVKVSAHRAVLGRVKTVQAVRSGRRWFLVLSCDDVPTEYLEPTGECVGIDVGINVFAVTSDRELVENPRFARKSGQRLAKAQKALAGKKLGSKNRQALKLRIGRRHAKVRNQRSDFQHKTASKPDAENPGQFLPNGQAAKSGLNRSIQDAGWAQFRATLEGKAEKAGRRFVVVNPRHTSQTCPECGHVSKDNRDGIKFVCVSCGHVDHADIVGATNIVRAGLALLATEQSVA